jgi:hypothetical protein
MADEVLQSESAPEVTTPESTEAPVEATAAPAEQAAVEKKIEALENKPKLTKVEAKTLKQLRLKVDGQEFLEDLPFEIPNTKEAIEYTTRQLQLARASQARMGETAQIKKEVQRFIEDFRKNPRKVMEDPSFGIDVKKFAAQILEEEINNSKKSPEQLEKEKLQSKIKELEEERKKEKEELQKREFEMLQTQAYEEYDRDITAAISESTLPKSSYTVKKVADYMLLGLQQGIDVKAKDVIPLVEEEIRKDLKEMFSVLPQDVVEALIGKETLGKFRKKNVAQAKQVAANPSKGIDVGKKTEVAPKPVKKMTIRDYLKV